MVLEKTLESPLDCKEIQLVHPHRNHSWIFIVRTDAKTETPFLWPPELKNWLMWKRRKNKNKNRCLDRLQAGGEGDAREWDAWMASLTWWTWVWVDSESWWWPGRPGMLRFMGLQRVGHNRATELTDWNHSSEAICPKESTMATPSLKDVDCCTWGHHCCGLLFYFDLLETSESLKIRDRHQLDL